MTEELIVMGSLRIECNGNYVYLSENGMALQSRFLPAVPEQGDTSVTDTADCVIYIGKDNLRQRAVLNSINRMFILARHWQATRAGHAVYLEFKPSKDDADYYRTEIIDGLVMLEADGEELRVLDSLEVNVVVTHVPYWEGPETQIPLSSLPYDNRSTNAVTVYNPAITYANDTISFWNNPGPSYEIHDADSGLAGFGVGTTIRVIGTVNNDGLYTVTHSVAGLVVVAEALVNEAAGTTFILAGQPRNFVDIAEGDVLGDLEAPIRLEFTDQYTGIEGFIRDIWVAHHVADTPSDLVHIWEAEDGYAGTPGVYHSSEFCSNGAYIEYGLVAAPASTLIYHSFATGQLDAMGSNWFRILMRLENPIVVTDAWLRVSIYAGNLTLVYQSDWVNIPSNKKLFELVTLQMPPYLADGGVTNLYVRIEGKSATGANIDYDFLQMSPMFSWRKYIANADGLDGTVDPIRLVDDEIDNYLYADDGADSDKRYAYYSTSAPIMLMPGMNQRLYFLWENYSSPNYYAHIVANAGVKVFYRPRRSTI